MQSISSENTSKKVSFHTLGCRLNFSESSTIAQGFIDRGYDIVEFGEPSDVVFLNTCTVTDGADSTCRNLIRKAHSSSPEAKIVVAGCYAQMEAETIKKIQGVDLILGTTEKYKVFDYLGEENELTIKIDKTNEFYGAATTEAQDNTRAFLKIQDGCNYVCSFCIIPFARGRSRTISIDDAISEAKVILSRGFKEIVLTGVNIGEYEHTSGEKLIDLVKRLVELDGLKRLRFSSVEPNTITRELLEVLKDSGKYQNHFHIPLQSADDEILKSMRRKYTSAQYREILWMVKHYFPETAIGADIITGYPGESEKQFQNTFEFLKHEPVTHFHVFPFSKRKGTTAAKLEDQIQSGVKKDRVRALIGLGDAKLDMFAQDLVGKKTEVLFEKEKNGFFEGYTSHFMRFNIKSDADLSNQIRSVMITGQNKNKLTGEILQ